VERVEEINLKDACNPQNMAEERLVCIPFDTAVTGSADDISSIAGLQEQISISKQYETLRYNFQKKIFVCVLGRSEIGKLVVGD